MYVHGEKRINKLQAYWSTEWIERIGNRLKQRIHRVLNEIILKQNKSTKLIALKENDNILYRSKWQNKNYNAHSRNRQHRMK